jgi:WD40 repeat protein
MKVIKAHSRRINDLAFSPDGKLLVSGGIDGTVRITDTHTGSCEVLIPAHKTRGVHWERVAFCAGGAQVICRSGWGMGVWDVAARRRVANLISRVGGYSLGLAVSPTCHVAVANEWISRPYAHVIHHWDTRTWAKSVLFRTTENYNFSGLAFDSTGTRLATCVGTFDVATGARLSSKPISGTSLEWSPVAPLVAGVSYSNVLTVTHAETGEQVAQLALEWKHVQDCAFSPDGRFLAVVSNEAAVRVWETATWTEQKEFAWGIGKLKCIAFAPDGLRAACGSDSGRILIWDWDL